MTSSELLQRVRSRLNDLVGDSSSRLWSDAEIIDDYANLVRDRLFRDCPGLLIDSATATDAAELPLCQIPIVANTATYAISPKILRVARLKLASQTTLLTPIAVADLDMFYPGWEDADAGEPWGYCLDYSTDKVRFIPTPNANDTARLTVHRFPLTAISLSNDNDLGFRAEYQNDLIPGILAQAFSKEDAVAVRPELAAMEESRFAIRLAEIRYELLKRTETIRTNRPLKAFL